jgi:hypothetical protein
MQMTAAQAGAFWAGLMHGKLINSGDLQALLGDWVINKSGAVTWAGQGFAKNGGYTISCLENDCGGDGSPNGLGQVSAAVVSPSGIDTQITVFTNFWGSMPSTAPADAQGPSVVGMDWIAFHPLDTVSIASRNPAAREALCLNIKGGRPWPNTPIIQYKCGTQPTTNELFVKVASVTAPGVFMLQPQQTLFGVGPDSMCLTSGGPAILSSCDGAPGQMFTLTTPSSNGTVSLVVQGSSQCLAAADKSGAGGVQIVQAPCSSSDPSQRFVINSATQ